MNAEARRIVVVADDDASVRRLVARYLRRLGCDVFEARDGVEAVQLVLEHEPDLLVLDARMPGLSGYEVTRELRRRLPTHIPVLLISGSFPSAEISDGLEAEADAYLRKPFSGQELSEVVGVLLATAANGGSSSR